MKLERFVVAIDGPSGTGKSSVAKEVARRLRAGYLDTGAMYRLVSLVMLRAGIDVDDDAAVADHLPLVALESPLDPDDQRHLLDGDEVTLDIRGAAVTTAVTPVSANPAVRQWLFARQQDLAHSGRMVVEGRDIGTVIAPDAELKIFLTADPQVRARRRQQQNAAAGTDLPTDTGRVQADLLRRDRVDSTRAVAPLMAAADAVEVDSTALTLEQVVDTIVRLAAERGIG